MRTEEKILKRALEMFNERGVEYVGLREIAATLNIRVSNITYYFPTKDDLVNRLSLDLSKLNAEVVIVNDQLTMGAFLKMLNNVFSNHVRYRCLLLSFVHLMEQNEWIAARYKNTQSSRNKALHNNLVTLVQSGYLKGIQESDLSFLVSTLALIVRFWISEAAVSLRHMTTEDQIRHYLLLICQLLWPYASPKGKKALKAYMEN